MNFWPGLTHTTARVSVLLLAVVGALAATPRCPSSTAPCLLLAHHKTGTLVALRLHAHLCRAVNATAPDCCYMFRGANASLGWVLQHRRPRFAVAVFTGRLELPALWAALPELKLVHFVRHPLAIVRSAFHYHAGGHEPHPLLLAWRAADRGRADGGARVLTSGVAGRFPFCEAEVSNRSTTQDERLWLASAVDLVAARAAAGQRSHQQVLQGLPLADALVVEAAWSWCEISRMVDVAASVCRLDRQGHRSVQLDIEHVDRRPHHAAHALAALLTATPALRPPDLTLAEARGIEHFVLPSVEAHKSTLNPALVAPLMEKLVRNPGVVALLRSSTERLAAACPTLTAGPSWSGALAAVAGAGAYPPDPRGRFLKRDS